MYCLYDVAKWAANHTREDEKIGAFQGGAIGYFTGRQVVNLDGKVNPQALEALKNRTLDTCLRESGIDIILDRRNVIDLFLLECDGTDLSSMKMSRIIDEEDHCMPGWVAYRILDDSGIDEIGDPASFRRHIAY